MGDCAEGGHRSSLPPTMQQGATRRNNIFLRDAARRHKYFQIHPLCDSVYWSWSQMLHGSLPLLFFS